MCCVPSFFYRITKQHFGELAMWAQGTDNAERGWQRAQLYLGRSFVGSFEVYVIMFVCTYIFFLLTPRPCVQISNLVKGFLFYNSEFVKTSETYISDNTLRRINVVPTFLSPPLNNSTVQIYELPFNQTNDNSKFYKRSKLMRLSCYYFFTWQRTNQINRTFI